MTQTAEKPPSREALEQGYEPPGVSNRGMLIFFVCFVTSAVLIHVGVWFLLTDGLTWPRPADAVTSVAPPQQRFPPPDLQPVQSHNELPYEDLHDLRKEKDAIFQQFGWSVDEKDVGRIPDNIVNDLASGRRAKPATKPSDNGL